MESGIECLSHGEEKKTRFTGIARSTVLVEQNAYLHRRIG
jgi:hypothetical protein